MERKARTITIHGIECLGHPAVEDYLLRVSCSKGTYIRTLAEDIGKALGVPATLAALRRTRAGAFAIEQAHTLPDILQAAQEGRVEDWILDVDAVFPSLPALTANEGVCRHLMNGCPTSHYAAADGRYPRVHRVGQLPWSGHRSGRCPSGGKAVLRAGIKPPGGH